jgi:hypothetical protein
VIPVTSFQLILRTNPPQQQVGGIDAALQISLANVNNPVLIPIRSAESLAAIAALIQVPGKLFFVAAGAELIKQG